MIITRCGLHTKQKTMKKESSSYYKFHSTYLGYDFRNVITGKLYSKGMFWDSFRGLAENLFLDPERPEPPPGFILQKRPKRDID